MIEAKLPDEEFVTYDARMKPDKKKNTRRTIVRVVGKRIGRVETETILGDGGAEIGREHRCYLDTMLREPVGPVFKSRVAAVRFLAQAWGSSSPADCR